MTQARLCLIVMLPWLVACAGGASDARARSASAERLPTLEVRPVEWNPGRLNLGTVRAVADTGSVVAVFANDRATILSAGVVVATDRSVRGWSRAAVIPGADGSPGWITGIGGDGRVYRLGGTARAEEISGRYGLGRRRVLGETVLGEGLVSFLLDREVAIADGKQVVTLGTDALRDLVGGAGFGAGVARDELEVFDAARHAATTYKLAGIKEAAIDRAGRLYAVTARGLYASSPPARRSADTGVPLGGSALDLVYDSGGDRLHGLAASGDNVWFADGPELGVVDGNMVRETRGASLASNAALAPASHGDVWVFAGTSLRRFARADTGSHGLSAEWADMLEPIFTRSCAGCHQPDGDSGTDLSTGEAWQSRRREIRDRVVVRKTMPPAGHSLSDTDREAIDSWTQDTGD